MGASLPGRGGAASAALRGGCASFRFCLLVLVVRDAVAVVVALAARGAATVVACGVHVGPGGSRHGPFGPTCQGTAPDTRCAAGTPTTAAAPRCGRGVRLWEPLCYRGQHGLALFRAGAHEQVRGQRSAARGLGALARVG